MQTQNVYEDRIKKLLVAHPAILGEDGGRTQESSHVVHCMQCELQFQVDIAAQCSEGQTDQKSEEIMHIRPNQQYMQESKKPARSMRGKTIPATQRKRLES